MQQLIIKPTAYYGPLVPERKRIQKIEKNIFELLKFVIFKIAMTNKKMPATYKQSIEEVYS